MKHSGTRLRGNWLVTLPLAALTALYMFCFAMPQQRATRLLQADLEENLAYAARAPQVMAETNRVQQSLQEAKAFVEAWQSRTPKGAGSAIMLGDISRLAREAGTRTTRLEPATTADYEQLRALAMTLACTGTFEQIYALLAAIEAMPQSIWIDDLKLERRQQGEEGLQCELRLEVFSDKSKISD